MHLWAQVMPHGLRVLKLTHTGIPPKAWAALIHVCAPGMYGTGREKERGGSCVALPARKNLWVTTGRLHRLSLSFSLSLFMDHLHVGSLAARTAVTTGALQTIQVDHPQTGRALIQLDIADNELGEAGGAALREWLPHLESIVVLNLARLLCRGAEEGQAMQQRSSAVRTRHHRHTRGDTFLGAECTCDWCRFPCFANRDERRGGPSGLRAAQPTYASLARSLAEPHGHDGCPLSG